MISQSQMNEWVHKAVERFQAVIPPIDALYPDYRIVTDGTDDAIRQTLLEKTGSQAFICTDVAPMETLHGPRGNAILVYQELFNALLSGDDGEEMFKHFYWHELGRFYSLVNSEAADPALFRFSDQKPHPDEFEALLGYAFWNEFIAEVIACKVDPDPVIDWENFDWRTTHDVLMNHLNDAFNVTALGWYDLAFYFAKVLADKTTVQFIKKARNGTLKIYNHFHESITFQEMDIDPTLLFCLSPQLQPIVKRLQKKLTALLRRDKYWEITLDDLNSIGGFLYSLERSKAMNDSLVRLRNVNLTPHPDFFGEEV